MLQTELHYAADTDKLIDESLTRAAGVRTVGGPGAARRGA